MLRVIQAVAQGEALFGAAIAAKLTAFFHAPRVETAVFPDLTEREVEVLHLIAQGLSNQEIGKKLFISSKTVRNHASNIFSKLQVADRVQAIIRARNVGLG